MKNQRVILGSLAATAVIALAPGSASAAVIDHHQGVSQPLAMAVDAYGRVTLASHDIGNYLTDADLQIGEVYAGNNCSCKNSVCGPHFA